MMIIITKRKLNEYFETILLGLAVLLILAAYAVVLRKLSQEKKEVR